MRRPLFIGASSLWWWAIFAALTGGTITFLFSLDRLNPDARVGMAISLVVTILVTGMCIICATANWWMHR